MKDIVVLLLAAGRSLRLWPLEDKHFVKFFDKPLVYYSIAQLRRFGFINIIVVVNAENKPLFERLGSEFKDISFTFVQQGSIKGMAGAVISAAKYIFGKKLLVVGPSDVYEDILLSNFRQLVRTSPDGILTGTIKDEYFPGGYLTVDKGVVTKIVEKPPPCLLPSNIVNFVFDYFKKSDMFIDFIKKIEAKTKTDDVYEKAIMSLIQGGWTFKYLSYKGYWGYLKYPWHILSLSSYFLGKLSGKKIKNASISKSSMIDNDVLIEDGVKIMENVKIVGPTYIGKGTIIGQNCLIREAMIGANCLIGYSCEITRSLIGSNCWFHNNYIGDSVIVDNVGMGAGAVIANFRLDEKPISSVVSKERIDTGKLKLGAVVGRNVRIGVNSSVMPGVKIGKNSFLGAGVVLDKDLPDNKFCSLKGRGYTICDNKAFTSPETRSKIVRKLKF